MATYQEEISIVEAETLADGKVQVTFSDDSVCSLTLENLWYTGVFAHSLEPLERFFAQSGPAVLSFDARFMLTQPSGVTEALSCSSPLNTTNG